MFDAHNASVKTAFRRGFSVAVFLSAGLGMAVAAEAFSDKGLADRQLLPPAPPEITRLAPSKLQVRPEAVLRDMSELPAPVALMRSRILSAAKSGDLNAVKSLITDNSTLLTSGPEPADEPIRMWRKQYPESDGIEILSVLAGLLESGFVRLEAGTEREIYVWPYFAHVPLKTLDPPRLVELYRLLTAFDVQRMREAGAYTFFRLGIGADGTWHYFVSGQ